MRPFVGRALLTLPSFALTAENVPEPSRRCAAGSRGVPLALELAVAKMGAMAAE